jgi:GT2 family glycosyltransferase
LAVRRVSVVICTWNRADSLRLALESLGYLAYPTFGVVVVAGPCTDHTNEVLEAYEGLIKVVHTSERNVSASRNLGLAAAAGEIVAFMDDDAVPDAMWLDELAEAFDRPEVAATGGPVFDHTGHRLQARYNIANRWGDARVELDARRLDFLEHPDTWEFVYTIGTNSLFRRQALIDIGGFDETFAFYLEETDVCLRLKDRGYLVLPQDRGLIHHKFLPSQIRDSQRITVDRYQVLVSRLYFAFRHGLPRSNDMKLWFAFNDFVRMHRADLLGHAHEKRIPMDAVERFDVDVDRAYAAVMEKLARTPPIRPSPWFDAQRAEPFRPFAARTAPARRYRVCLLTDSFAEGVRRYASGLAQLGHVVHVITGVADRHSTVDFEGGLWVHRIETSDHFYSQELGRIAGFTPIDAVQVCDGVINDPDVHQYPALPPSVLSVDDAVIELGNLTAAPVA